MKRGCVCGTSQVPRPLGVDPQGSLEPALQTTLANTGTSGPGGDKDLLAWGQGKDSAPQNGPGVPSQARPGPCHSGLSFHSVSFTLVLFPFLCLSSLATLFVFFLFVSL